MLLSRLTIVLALVACGEKTIDGTDEDVVEEEVVDVDGDGIEESLDCDDSDADLGAIEDDTDCDGFLNDDDCGPEDADIYPDAEDAWYDGVDSNCDGADDYDQDGDGEVSADHDGTDCDDTDATINTVAEEVWYDGVDQNCDGLNDNDQDGDGEDSDQHGGTDCDDTDATINTVAEEVWYDGVDQNCDGLSDNDQDGDGEDSSDYGGIDCNDTERDINSAAVEIWYDGVDQNCDGLSDNDQDGDGEDSSDYGGADCDDLDGAVNTAAVEVWYDGVDQNCDGLSDNDQDGDGEDSSDYGGADCDDLDGAINSAAVEIWYDGVDQNCDGLSDYDQDGDGIDQSTDCVDTDASIYPGAPDAWYDGVDSDCAGDNDYDQDGDGFGSLQYLQGGDCNDGDASVNPNATEYCDGIDHDCNFLDYEPGLVTHTDSNGTQNNLSSISSTPRNGNSSFANIAGGQLDICEGTYYTTIVADEDLEIYGHGSVIIDGEDTDPGIHVANPNNSGGVDVIIDGVHFDNSYSDYYGTILSNGDYMTVAGGLSCVAGSSLYPVGIQLNNVEFTGSEGGLGGAIYSSPWCDIDATNLTVQGGVAQYGGAMYVRASLTMTNADLNLNSSSGSGGAIFIDGNKFTPNYSSGASGDSIPYEIVEIENSNISYNLSDGYGGGLYIKDMGTVLDTVTIQGNVADYGGGIYQREANTFVSDGSIEDNIANVGSAIRLYDNDGTTNMLTCAAAAPITGNSGQAATSGAVHVTGAGSVFTSESCIIGGNSGTYDVYQTDLGGSAYSSQGGNWIDFYADSSVSYEDCMGTTDTNSDGNIGFDDPYCTLDMGTNVLSSQRVRNVEFNSCSNSMPGNPMDSFVVPYGDLHSSGCVTTEVLAGHSNDIYVSVLSDTSEETCVANENNTGGTSNTEVSVFVERSEALTPNLISTRVSVPRSDPSNVQVYTSVEHGQDCDGNCCYDVLMLDDYGDGWNGAELQIYEGFSVVETLTLADGYQGWGTFCIEANLPWFLYFDDTNQSWDDGETLVVMQGNNSGGSTTMCTIGTDMDGVGIVTDCAPNNGGVMYCQ